MKPIVVYYSKYGACRQYAEWICEALDCTIVKLDQIQSVNIADYDLIIFGAPIYCGQIPHDYFYLANEEAKKIIFTVGILVPEETDFTAIIENNFPCDLIDQTDFFHFRGAIKHANLSIKHRCLLWLIKQFNYDRILGQGQGPIEPEIKQVFEDDQNFIDKKAIQPLIDHVQSGIK